MTHTPEHKSHIARNTISALDFAPAAFRTQHFVADSLGLSAFSKEVQDLMSAVAIVPAMALEIKDDILFNGNFSSGIGGADGWSVTQGSMSVSAGVATVTITPGAVSYLRSGLNIPHVDIAPDDPLNDSTGFTNQIVLMVKFKVSNIIRATAGTESAIRCRLGTVGTGDLGGSSESQTIVEGHNIVTGIGLGQTYEELMVMSQRPHAEPASGWTYDFRIQALNCASYDIENVSVHRIGMTA